MPITNYQDPQSSETRSTHISGLMDAVGKIEDAIGLSTISETNVPLNYVLSYNPSTHVQEYRIYQAPVGKRNWLSSPAPVVYKNGSLISTGFTIDYGGGAIIVSPAALSSDTFAADITHTSGKMISNYSDVLETTAPVISLPSTVMPGPFKTLAAKGNTDVNIIKNGNFTDTSSWAITAGATISVANNVLSILGNGTDATPRAAQNLGAVIASKKLFIRALMRVTNSNCASVSLNIAPDGTGTAINAAIQTNPIQNQWYLLFGIAVVPTDWTGNMLIRLRHNYADTVTANGKVMEVKEVMVIDLQARFGAGNEPDAAACALRYPNWFDGVKSVGPFRVKSVGKNVWGSKKAANDVVRIVGNALRANLSVVDGRNCLALIGNDGLLNKPFFRGFEPNTRYTMRCWCRRNETNQGGFLCFTYSDGTITQLAPTSTTWQEQKITSSDGKSIVAVYATYSVTAMNYFDYDTLQVQKGTVFDSFEPYTETAEYTSLSHTTKSVPNGTIDMTDLITGADTKNISEWVNLDGSLSWGAGTNFAGFKTVIVPKFADSFFRLRSSLVYKYNGVALTELSNTPYIADTYTNNISFSENYMIFCIANSDTGFPDGYVPAVNEIKAYFWGWQACNSDGTIPWLKSETPYTPSTWAEWAKDSGVVGDSTGLELTADGTNNKAARLTISLKVSTKYGVIVNVVTNTMTAGKAKFDPNNYIGALYDFTGSGNKRFFFTTPSTIAVNRFDVFAAADISGNKLKIKDIRMFELPAGSQIETDFNTLTGDQLSEKYGFYGLGTKYWKKITDGTGLTSTQPTASYAGYTPYKMIYQFAAPIISTVEGLGGLTARANGALIIEPGIIKFEAKPVSGVITIPDTTQAITSIESVRKITMLPGGDRQYEDVIPASNTTTTITLSAGYDDSKTYEAIYATTPGLLPTLTYSYPINRAAQADGMAEDISRLRKSVAELNDFTVAYLINLEARLTAHSI